MPYTSSLSGVADMSDAERLREAASILSDFFSSTVLRGLEENPPRRFLYEWEKRALAWLKEQRTADKDTMICMWTASYLEDGPPPWNKP